MKLTNFIFILLIGVGVSNWISSANFNQDEYYVGAVVDYAPVDFNYQEFNKTTAQLYMLENLENYSDFTKEAKKNGGQIVVFSEYGICGTWSLINTRDDFYNFLEVIPDPTKEKVIACNNPIFSDRPIFSRLSCIAKENSIYLAVDYGDLQYCDPKIDGNCPEDGRYQFNAELVFSPDGLLVAKYYKSHLFEEASFADYPPSVEPIYVDTDFGVRFGMFICFDIMWKQPQTDLIEKYGVENILYSTEWINNNIVPAVQIQQSWSKVNGLNILASNSGSSKNESGSGIYSNGEILTYTINSSDDPKSTLLISKIPKHPKQAKTNILKQVSKKITLNNIKNQENFENNIKRIESDSISQHIDDSILTRTFITNNPRFAGIYNFTAIPFQLVPDKKQSIQAIHNNLTCTFTFNSPSNKKQLMALVAYDGILQNNPQEEKIKVQICSTFICSGEDDESCSTIAFNSDIKLSSFILHGTFGDGYQYYPLLNVVPFDNVGNYDKSANTLSANNIENYEFIGASFFNPFWGSLKNLTFPETLSSYVTLEQILIYQKRFHWKLKVWICNDSSFFGSLSSSCSIICLFLLFYL
ncbi:hypothetical protein ACTA71_000065 [Dictyostelium dimigraforme]